MYATSRNYKIDNRISSQNVFFSFLSKLQQQKIIRKYLDYNFFINQFIPFFSLRILFHKVSAQIKSFLAIRIFFSDIFFRFFFLHAETFLIVFSESFFFIVFKLKKEEIGFFKNEFSYEIFFIVFSRMG